MKKSVLLTFIISLLVIQLKAQNLTQYPVSRNTLSLSVGMHQLSVQDLNASPLVYTGKLPQLTLQYKHRFTKGEIQMGLRARYGNFKPKAYPSRAINYGEVVVPVESKLVAGNFFLNYLHQIHQSQNGAILVGSGIQQLLQYPLEAPNAGLVAITSVPIILGIQHQFTTKNSFQSQVQYSLAGLVTRMPYHATISLPGVTSNLKALYKSNTQFQGGHQLKQFSWHSDFQHHINKRFTVGLTYELERLHHATPRQLSSWSNSLSISPSLRF